MHPEPAILLIEPDAATRELYHRELSSAYRVFSYPDIGNALDILLTHNIRALVIEPTLRRTSGWEFVARITQMPDTRHIPVIVCSVLDERGRGKECGVYTYLIKPVLPSTLLEVLGRVQDLPKRPAAHQTR